MNLLQLDNVGQAFGANDLFEAITVQVNRKDRIGLVGPNGVGKTMLLRILAGLDEPTEGRVMLADGVSLGYLRQEAVLTFAGQENSIYEEMLTVFANLQQMEADLREMEAQMAVGDLSESLLERYGEAQALYEHGGGYGYEHDIKRVLMGLGFPPAVWETPLTHLSGGQKTRVLLSRLLLEQPDLLILDEPTNHLDTSAIIWLEETLRQWSGALITVSHDRYFLDKVVNLVWELTSPFADADEAATFTIYKGNYSRYVAQREQVWEREVALFESEKERLMQELGFIRKHIAGGKTDIAKGKLRRLTRDIVLLEEFGAAAMQNKSWLQIGERVRTFSSNEAARRLRALTPPAAQPATPKLELAVDELSSRRVLRSKDLVVGYPTKRLFASEDFKLERHDCAALIGPNGSGKSTLLRTIMGELKPLAGYLRFGDSIKLGYFAQGHDQLNMGQTVLQEVMMVQETNEQEARNYLARYLFRGDDVFKQVSDLSGGERGRLALALLALGGANFLLLDEPTNHLDIPSQEVLQEVLERFDGTILLVSHDRYLVSRLATQIWEIAEDGLTLFNGRYADYLTYREAPEEPDVLQGIAEQPDVSWVTEIEPSMPSKRRLNREVLEKMMGDLQDELEAIRLAHGEAVAAGDEGETAVLRAEFEDVDEELDDLILQWEQLTGLDY